MSATVIVKIIANVNVIDATTARHLITVYDAERVTAICGCGNCDNIVDTFHFNVNNKNNDPIVLGLQTLAENDELRMETCAPEISDDINVIGR